MKMIYCPIGRNARVIDKNLTDKTLKRLLEGAIKPGIIFPFENKSVEVIIDASFTEDNSDVNRVIHGIGKETKIYGPCIAVYLNDRGEVEDFPDELLKKYKAFLAAPSTKKILQ